MRSISLSEETFRALVILKNNWSFQRNRVTNKDVLKALEETKRGIYGYDSTTPPKEVEEFFRKRSREENERDGERFAKAYREILASGYDFEPEFTVDQCIKEMLGVIDQELEPF